MIIQSSDGIVINENFVTQIVTESLQFRYFSLLFHYFWKKKILYEIFIKN